MNTRILRIIAITGVLVAPACHRPRIEARPPIVSGGIGAPITVTELSAGIAPPPAGHFVRRQLATLTSAARDLLTPSTLRRGARLRFELFEKLDVTAVVEYVEPYRDTGVAAVALGETHAGHVVLTYAAGQLTVFFSLPDEGDVEIEPVASNRLVASQLARELPVMCRTSARQVQGTLKWANGYSAPAGVTSQIDVGVLYTAASGDEPGLRRKLDTWAIASSKYFSCSGINARANMIQIQKLGYQETGKLETDLTAFDKLGQNPGDTVLKFREDNQVDIVLVLVAKGDDYGLANVFDTKTGDEFKNRATGVAVAKVAFGHVLLHELGHTMGGGHEPGEGEGRFSYSHGNVIKGKPEDRLTLMAAGSGFRLTLFSGPQVPLGSVKTGSSKRDNVRTLNETRGMVEVFQQSKRPFMPAIPCGSTLFPPLTSASKRP